MIYEALDDDAPIRQGDIFRAVPRVDLSLGTIPVVERDGQTSSTSWRDFIADPEGEEALAAVVSLRPVNAIVISQDCDATRSESLSLCQIYDLTELDPSTPKTARKWVSKITAVMQSRHRLYYLPVDDAVGFSDRQAVDFCVVLHVQRLDLEAMRDRRVGRLNRVAYEHFRESLAQFFRRYPVNPWYPLNHAEFEAYAAAASPEEVEAYPWQKPI